jgi:hypothetical protein
MRKVLVFFAAVALVLALVPYAKAAGKYLGKADFNLRGTYWIWAFSNDNMWDFNEDIHDGRRYVYQRFRTYLDTSFEGKYGATFGIENDWWWGSDSSDPTRTLSIGGEPKGDDLFNVEVKHAYLWFLIPGTPAKVSAGLGVQGALDPNVLMFGRDDFFGVRVDVPIIKGTLNLSAAWLKGDEGDLNPPGYFAFPGADADTNETDYYYIKLSGSLLKVLSWGTYHMWAHVRNNGLITFGYPFVGILGGRFPLMGTDGEYFWHGIYGRFKSGIFYANLHFNYFWADMEDDPAEGKIDFDPNGWALLGHVGIRPGPFRIGIRGWYFTGNDDDWTTDLDWDRWVSPDGFFAPLDIMYSGFTSWPGGLSAYDASPGGTAFVGLVADWTVTKKLSLNLIGGYIWATEEEDKPFFAMYDENGDPNDDTGLGFEIDLHANYRIYSHLLLTLGAAYFIADDGLDNFLGSADDAYELFWRLFYTF